MEADIRQPSLLDRVLERASEISGLCWPTQRGREDEIGFLPMHSSAQSLLRLHRSMLVEGVLSDGGEPYAPPCLIGREWKQLQLAADALKLKGHIDKSVVEVDILPSDSEQFAFA